MRLCFVGYGSIAEAHAKAFRQIPGIELGWVVGRDPAGTEAFAREWGFGGWTLDLAEALAADVDGVVITSPSDLHAAHAEAALRGGKHALVEIPLATDLAGAERVAEAARETRVRVQVAHTQRYYPALAELRRQIAARELRPHHLVCRWFFLRRDNVNWKGRRRTWTDNLLWHHGCHVVDACLWLLSALSPEGALPEAEGVTAQLGPPHRELGIPLDLDVQFRVGEVLVSVAMSYNSAWPVHSYFVIGERGSLEYNQGKLWDEQGHIYETGQADSILLQDREWVEAVREGREPAVSCDSVLPAMRALAAAEAWTYRELGSTNDHRVTTRGTS